MKIVPCTIPEKLFFLCLGNDCFCFRVRGLRSSCSSHGITIQLHCAVRRPYKFYVYSVLYWFLVFYDLYGGIRPQASQGSP